MIKDRIELSTALCLFSKLPRRSSFNKDVASRRRLDRNIQRGINRKLVHLAGKSINAIDDRCCMIQKRKIFWFLEESFRVRWQLLKPHKHLKVFFVLGICS